MDPLVSTDGTCSALLAQVYACDGAELQAVTFGDDITTGCSLQLRYAKLLERLCDRPATPTSKTARPSSGKCLRCTVVFLGAPHTSLHGVPRTRCSLTSGCPSCTAPSRCAALCFAYCQVAADNMTCLIPAAVQLTLLWVWQGRGAAPQARIIAAQLAVRNESWTFACDGAFCDRYVAPL